MSEVLWVRVEGRADEPDPMDHSLLFELTERLNTLAAQLGVTPLSAFYDWADYEYNRSDAGEDESWIAEHARWHEAPAVLSSLRSIAQAMRHTAMGEIDEDTAAALQEELNDCITRVQEAAEQGRRVHLCVVM